MSIQPKSLSRYTLIRRSISILFVSVFGTGFLMEAAAQEVVTPTFRVATFDVDATPPVGAAMAYDPVRRVDELTLRCRGVVLLGAGQPIVLCAVDWIGIANEGHDVFRDALADAAGTSRERVAVHTLHQHDAPGCDFTAERLLSELGVDSRHSRFEGTFHRQVIARAATEVGQSIQRAQPVTHYGWGTADVENVASNRRILGDDGKVRAVRFTTCRDPEIRAEPVGVIDPEVSLLSFWNGDQPVAVLSYYACHPQSYYRTGVPSPDFPGIARFIRGQTLPDTLHVHFNGAGGNIGAGKYNDGNKANRMILAQRLAAGMKQAFDSTDKRQLNLGDIGWESHPVKLQPADHLVRKDLIESIRTQPLQGYIDHADQLAWLDRCESGGTIDISCLRVGSARVIHMPGELFVEYQLSAKLMRPTLNIAMAAYGDYGPGYIGTQVAYSQGGYETSARASSVTPLAERTLTTVVRRLLEEPPEGQPESDQTDDQVDDQTDDQTDDKTDDKKGTTQTAQPSGPGPNSPQQALSTFELPAGFEMQLVASEPEVREPVVICYDAAGQMYAAEFLKFPTILGESDGPSGQVRLLRDLDQDGHYETSSVFADQLDWPTGICPWKGGVFVIAAPDLWYLKDTNGDGRADVRRKIFTGFGFSNEEGTANNLILGLDHWIYGAGSNSGGSIVRVDRPQAAAVSIRGRDFRFHPTTLEFEAVSGSEQFGNTFDDFGNRFICQNSKPAVHVVFPSRYLRRNPFQEFDRVRQDIWTGDQVFRISEPEPWRVARTKVRLKEQRNWAAPFVAHDVFTACSGVTIYRGNAGPASIRGNLIVGDVQSNLVHRRRLEPDSISFVSSRIDRDSELIRSSDNWFRPVNFCNAPDGTLHVVDMYREVIETPDSLPAEILASVNLNRGHSMGRIYRLAPTGFKPPSLPHLDSAGLAELVGCLGNPAGWWRDTASRILFERQDKAAVPLVRDRWEKSTSSLERLHLLYALMGLDALQSDDLALALSSESAVLREHGVRLAEQWMNRQDVDQNEEVVAAWIAQIAGLANDDEDRVRFQVALTLGEIEGESAADALLEILVQDLDHWWIQPAVLSSAYHHASALLQACIAGGQAQSGNWDRTLHGLARVVGGRAREPEVSELVRLLGIHPDFQRREPIVMGLGEGLAIARTNFASVLKGPDLKFVTELLSSAWERSRVVLASSDATERQRIDAIRMLSQDPSASTRTALMELIDAAQTPAVQLAAIRALSSFDESGIGGGFLRRWKQSSPAIRAEIVETMLTRRDWTTKLLEEIRSGQFSMAAIPPLHRNRLLDSRDALVQQLAGEVFQHWKASGRADAIARFRPAANRGGDPVRGEQVFREQCATCHQFNHVRGHDVGPNLATVRGRSAEQLLIQILDPNRELLANFVVYSVALADGRFVSGMISAETPTSITLKRAEGVQETILRQNIEEISASGKSLMPEGLEETISPQQMSDLLTFLTIE